jgi:hypothetical protein
MRSSPLASAVVTVGLVLAAGPALAISPHEPAHKPDRVTSQPRHTAPREIGLRRGPMVRTGRTATSPQQVAAATQTTNGSDVTDPEGDRLDIYNVWVVRDGLGTCGQDFAFWTGEGIQYCAGLSLSAASPSPGSRPSPRCGTTSAPSSTALWRPLRCRPSPT